MNKIEKIVKNISKNMLTPATFKLISTEMEDISECEKKIDKIIEKNKVVLINKS